MKDFTRRCGRGAALFLLTLGLSPGAPHASDEHAHHHHHADATPAAVLRQVDLAPPAVTLVREDGERVDLRDELGGETPVYVNFIYTTCTAICPAMSQIFASLQQHLEAKRAPARLLSVSIDPEHDTPRRLARYAHDHSAGPHWHFYTGTLEDSIAVQKAFDVYRYDKMNHTVVTFFRAQRDERWLRVDGFMAPEELARLGERARSAP